MFDDKSSADITTKGRVQDKVGLIRQRKTVKQTVLTEIDCQ